MFSQHNLLPNEVSNMFTGPEVFVGSTCPSHGYSLNNCSLKKYVYISVVLFSANNIRMYGQTHEVYAHVNRPDMQNVFCQIIVFQMSFAQRHIFICTFRLYQSHSTQNRMDQKQVTVANRPQHFIKIFSIKHFIKNGFGRTFNLSTDSQWLIL